MCYILPVCVLRTSVCLGGCLTWILSVPVSLHELLGSGHLSSLTAAGGTVDQTLPYESSQPQDQGSVR